MRKKIKYNLGGIPPGGPVRTNWTPSPNAALDFMSGMGMIQPGPVTSGTYGMFSKQLQPLGSSPLDAMNQVNSFNLGQAGGPGSGMGGIHQGLGVLEQQLAMPENEFDQVQDTITKAKKTGNMIARGRDAVQHARNVKKAADVASAAGGDVTNLLGNLGAMGSGEVAKQGAKTGVGQFIANAGASKFGTFLSSGAGAAASAGAGILGKAIQELDKKDGKFSRAGAMGGGALQGAAIGSALGPIGTVAGAAIGAGIGELQRAKFEQNAINEELTKKTKTAVEEAKNRLAGRSILKTFPVEGIKEQVYALGGNPSGKNTLPITSYGPQIPLNVMQAANNGKDVLRQGVSSKKFDETSNAIIDKRSLEKAKTTANNVVDYHVNHPLDAIGLDLAALGQVPIFGEPADLANAALSAGRSAYYGYKGDTAKAGKHAGLSALSATSALPLIGNVTGSARLAHGTHKLTHGAHNMERGIIAAKAADAASKYAHGGHTNNPDYLAEGGEMIQHAPGDLPKTDNNGSVTPVTKTIARINGDKHIAASGGVGMEGKEPARIYSDQLAVPKELIKQLSKL